MCFSPEASFTAAAVLGGMGIATLRVAPNRSQFFLAAIPILFAIQQFSEGIVWLGLEGYSLPHGMLNASKFFFLFFAFLIWPIWIPFAIMMAEQNPLRKKMIMVIVICGLVLSCMNLIAALGQSDISVRIMGHSLQYIGIMPDQTYAYPIILLLPSFITSIRNMPLWAICIAISYAVAAYFYTVTFVSVWCFFSAIISIGLYKILKESTDSETKNLSF